MVNWVSVIEIEQADCWKDLYEVSNRMICGLTWMACDQVSRDSFGKRLVIELIRPVSDRVKLP